MMKLYDEVRVKTNGAIGTVVDIDEEGMLTIEGHKGETQDNAVYGKEYPLYYVSPEDVEKTDDDKKRLNIARRVAVF